VLRDRTRFVALASLVVCCGGHNQRPIPAAPFAQEVEATFYLIGDAGAPDARGEPVLSALQADIAATSSTTVVVFLGDNLYPSGMPPAGWPERAEAERRLRGQIDAARSATHVLFEPGNHDWNYAGDGGYSRLIAQETFGRSVAPPNTEWVPGGGCPGPAVRDFGNVRILVLDTYWLLGAQRLAGSDPACAADTQEQVLDSIRTVLAGAGERRVFVVAHHPMVSGGTHGGHFTLRQHLFPLTDLKPWLWLPLPVIGSAYPLARKLGLSDQDLSSRAYRSMRDSLESAFRTSEPILFAAGHDHSLQVLRGIGTRYQVVSGAGIFGHNTPVSWTDHTLFMAPGKSGYTRVEVQRDGRIRLATVIVTADGARSEGYSIYLE
jgi:hypothetical protein